MRTYERVQKIVKNKHAQINIFWIKLIKTNNTDYVTLHHTKNLNIWELA